MLGGRWAWRSGGVPGTRVQPPRAWGVQRRAPLNSTLGAESTRTPSPHFSAGRRVHRDARPPTPHFSAGRPRDAGSTRHPTPTFQRGAPPRPRSAGTPAPPLKHRPGFARTPTPPPHFSVGRLPGPDQQGPPPFHFCAGLPRVSGSTRRPLPPFQLGELPAQVRRDVPGCGPSHQVCASADAERRRPCAWSRVALGIRGFTGHLSLRRSGVKRACLTARGAGGPPV